MKLKASNSTVKRLMMACIFLFIIVACALYFFRGFNHEIALRPPPEEWPEEVREAIIRFREAPFHRRDGNDAVKIYNFFRQSQILDREVEGRYCGGLDNRLRRNDVIRYFGYPDISWEKHPLVQHDRFDYIVQLEGGSKKGLVFIFNNNRLHNVVFAFGYYHRGPPMEFGN